MTIKTDSKEGILTFFRLSTLCRYHQKLTSHAPFSYCQQHWQRQQERSFRNSWDGWTLVSIPRFLYIQTRSYLLSEKEFHFQLGIKFDVAHAKWKDQSFRRFSDSLQSNFKEARRQLLTWVWLILFSIPTLYTPNRTAKESSTMWDEFKTFSPPLDDK